METDREEMATDGTVRGDGGLKPCVLPKVEKEKNWGGGEYWF
jgi:hypothetical protein